MQLHNGTHGQSATQMQLHDSPHEQSTAKMQKASGHVLHRSPPHHDTYIHHMFQSVSLHFQWNGPLIHVICTDLAR